MIDATLLEEFMRTFYGYGTYDAPYWFVGMEEGGGKTLEANERKIESWKNRGQKELEDPRGDAVDLSGSPWFRANPKAQPTWKELIRMMLVAEGNEPSLEQIKAYQRDRFGRPDGEMCALELLPLPSPSIGHWFYKEYAGLDYLATRELYREHVAPFRAAHLRERVAEHKPKAVVFYSMNGWYRRFWQQIAAAPFRRISRPAGDYLRASTDETVYLIVMHPAARGLTTLYFEEAGVLLRTP